MYGAMIGDIAGSKYEFDSIKTKDFPLVSSGCTFTDDTVMTVAVAKALLRARQESASFESILVHEMQDFGKRYPGRGYGGMFARWLRSNKPLPYNSFGNGSAMRVSPCGLVATSLDEALALSEASARVTHDHPEGIKGAQAVAASIYLAKTGKTRDEIAAYVREHFYDLALSVDEIRPTYSFDVTCQGSVPEAIVCFLESSSFEDTVRNAVSLGGDSDTQAAIAGSIAWTYYRFGGDAWRTTEVEDADGWSWRSFAADTDDDRYCNSDAKDTYWPAWCNNLILEHGIDALLPAEFIDIADQIDRLWMQ